MDQHQYERLCLVCEEHERVDLADGYDLPDNIDDDTVMDFKVCCPECGQWYPFKTTLPQLEACVNRTTPIQDIYPDLDPGTREIVRPWGKYCGKCWDRTLGKEE